MLNTKMLGENIKALRKRRGLTQREFADALNVSFQAVSNWERGVTPPDLENLLRIAADCGVSIGSLFSPQGETLFFGVDGGGTKTEFAVVSSEGYVLKRFVLSGCNPNDIGYARTFELLSGGIDRILSEFPSIRNGFLGIAGVTTGDCAHRLQDDFKKRCPQVDLCVKSDAYNLFAMDDDADMVVISGTGSVVFVRNGDGYKRLGGWGYLLDRAGSAYDIGADALRAALREEDLGNPHSLLYERLLQKINAPTVWAHINTVYNEGKPYIASLASIVFDAYRAGDDTAEQIVDRNAKALAELLNLGTERCGARPVAVAGGGLFEHYADVMTAHIGKYSNVKLALIDLPPIYGACKGACTASMGNVTDAFYENFKRTYGGIGQ